MSDPLSEFADFRAASRGMPNTSVDDPGDYLDDIDWDTSTGTDPLSVLVVGRTECIRKVFVRNAPRASGALTSTSVGYALLDYAGAPNADLVPSEGAAFPLLDAMRTVVGQLRLMVNTLRRVGLAPYSSRLATRLDRLIEAATEEQFEWTEDSVGSLRHMLQFLQSAPSLDYPTVTVTPTANFRAEWRAARDAHFALEFLADGQVRYVVFSADKRRRGRIKRSSGLSSWDDVMDIVAPFGVEAWAARAGT